jgi:hypothetical protein
VQKPAKAVVAAQTKAPEPKPVQPTGDANFDKLAMLWNKVVSDLSAVSKVAAARLPKSSLVEVKGKVAKVQFERQSDAEWVSENTKLIKAAYEIWNREGGDGVTIQFEAAKTNGARPQPAEATTVELPAEGESLERLGREIFGQPAGEDK